MMQKLKKKQVKAPVKKKKRRATLTNKIMLKSETELRVTDSSLSLDTVSSTSGNTNLPHKKTNTSKPISVPRDESTGFESDTFSDDNDNKAKKRTNESWCKRKRSERYP